MNKPTPIMGKGKTKIQKQIWLNKYKKDEFIFKKNDNIDDFQEEKPSDIFNYLYSRSVNFDVNFIILIFIIIFSRAFRTSGF